MKVDLDIINFVKKFQPKLHIFMIYLTKTNEPCCSLVVAIFIKTLLFGWKIYAKPELMEWFVSEYPKSVSNSDYFLVK